MFSKVIQREAWLVSGLQRALQVCAGTFSYSGPVVLEKEIVALGNLVGLGN